MIGYIKITRAQFYASGAFSNPRNVRTQRGKAWTYWQRANY